MKQPLPTKTSWHSQLPRLDRFLLDTDVNVELESLLEAVGFDVKFALRVGVDVTNDTACLKWARRHRRILLCHDKHRDRDTRAELYPEIYRGGGRVIQISGGPGQDIYTSLGKLLLRREQWGEWFKEHQGIVTIWTTGINMKDASELYQIVQAPMPLEDKPEQTIRSRKLRHQKHKVQHKRQPIEQTSLGM